MKGVDKHVINMVNRDQWSKGVSCMRDRPYNGTNDQSVSPPPPPPAPLHQVKEGVMYDGQTL